MCRLLGYCSRGSASVAGLLTKDRLGAFTALSAYHCDGWGMAWYEGDGPQVRKSPQRAAEEPEYTRLAERALGDLGLVHLRWATPGLGIGYPNSHPFGFGPYTLAHNGAVHPQDRLGEMLPAEWERQLAGSTDSERYLLHIMWRLEERRGDMIAAIADTVASIAERYAVNSLNAVLLSPAKMYVISWHDPARIPAEELRRRGLASTPEEIAGYFHLAYLATPDAVVAASSGWPQPGWTMLPNNSVLMVDRVRLHMSAFSLQPASRAPAGRLAVGVRHSSTSRMIMGMWPTGGGRTNPPAQPTRPPASSSNGPPTCHGPRPAHSRKSSVNRPGAAVASRVGRPAEPAPARPLTSRQTTDPAKTSAKENTSN
jgi:predicted glutamine amidotransferase